MKRTPPWVFVAAVGVQLAALGLCLWAMERNLQVHDEENAPEPPAPEPAPPQPNRRPRRAETRSRRRRPRISPTLRSPTTHRGQPSAAPHRRQRPADAQLAEAPAHHASAEPFDFSEAAQSSGPAASAAPPPEPDWSPESPWRRELDPAPRQVIVRAVQRPPDTPPAPLFGPPPERALDPVAAPAFLTDAADATTQLVIGRMNEGEIAFGFYPDGNMRFVDVDGGRYIGRAESARARMREIDGMRAFTVQIGVGADQRFEATFTGGSHDAQTIGLEPLVGWSVA